MKLFRPRQQFEPRRSSGSSGMMEELERLIRRMRALPLAAPILLLVGLGAGKVTNSALGFTETSLETADAGVKAHLEAVSERMNAMNADGDRTVAYVKMYREHVEPVERVLQRHGISGKVARAISWPLVEQSYSKGLDPATVVSVLLIESGGKPTARSPVGARGLMQVMPLWLGSWKCGRDLYAIEDNICNGTSILAWYLKRHGTEQQALLGYNGCVRGTNTPNCHTYPNKIWKLREQVKGEITREREKIMARASTD